MFRPIVPRFLCLCLALCMPAPGYGDTPQEIANRDIATAFFNAVYNSRDFDEASQYLGEVLIQHTPDIGDGRAGLQAYIRELEGSFPESRREIKRVLTDDNHVIVQAHLVNEPGDSGTVTGDIFHLENGRITEHWGIVHSLNGTPHPDNPNDLFGANSAPHPAPTSPEQEQHNLALGIAFYHASLNEKDWGKAEQYMGDYYQQHSIYMEDGRAGFKALVERISRDYPQNLGEMKQIFADGDMVVLHLHVTRTRDTRGWTVIELMRLENDEVVEHWDIFQPVPETTASGNSLW